jgi:hypothetical protein
MTFAAIVAEVDAKCRRRSIPKVDSLSGAAALLLDAPYADDNGQCDHE